MATKRTALGLSMLAALFALSCSKGDKVTGGAGASTPSGGATDTAATAGSAAPATTTVRGPGSARVDGKNFALDLTAPGCKAGAECAMTLRLVTSEGYHINKEYPYKFVANAAPKVQFLGKSDAATFSRQAGDFKEDGETAATMTVRFKPESAGESKVTGTYKLSVCSADQCQIESQPVTLAVPVM